MRICIKCNKREGSWWDHLCQYCRNMPTDTNKAIEYEKLNSSKGVINLNENKTTTDDAEKKTIIKNNIRLFYIISLFFSYIIISDGTYTFSPWMIIAVPIFALWLNVPVIFTNNKNNKEEFIWVILGYLLWVGIQWLIYYFGLGPPVGAGAPHF